MLKPPDICGVPVLFDAVLRNLMVLREAAGHIDREWTAIILRLWGDHGHSKLSPHGKLTIVGRFGTPLRCGRVLSKGP